MPPPPKATLKDVAKRAGVHRSTVSLALRDHPRISEPVRLRIQGMAKKIGYRINPLVAALMQARRTKRTEKHVVLAYVTHHPTRFGWRPPHHNRPDNAAIFREWFRHKQPDALLVTHALPVVKWLTPLGKIAPRDLGLVALVNDHPEQNHSGVHYDPAKLGSLGIEMLVGLLHRDDTGVPVDQHEVLLTGGWLEGSTLRPLVPCLILSGSNLA